MEKRTHVQALHTLEPHQPQLQRLSELPLGDLKLLRRLFLLGLIEPQTRSVHKHFDPLGRLGLVLLFRVEDDRLQAGRLEERESEEQLFVGVRLQVGCWGRVTNEGGKGVRGGFVEALEGAGVEEGAEGSLIRGRRDERERERDVSLGWVRLNREERG